MNRILISISFGLMLAVLARAENKPVAAVQATCADKIKASPFVNVGGVNYIFGTTYLNFFSAAEFCRSQGAHLAWLENSDERDTLSTYMLSKGLWNPHWLSGNDLGQTGTLKWLGNGREIANLSQSDWAIYQPDERQSYEHCIQFINDGEKLVVSFTECKRSGRAICKATVCC